jgi:hypothetical protein
MHGSAGLENEDLLMLIFWSYVKIGANIRNAQVLRIFVCLALVASLHVPLATSAAWEPSGHAAFAAIAAQAPAIQLSRGEHRFEGGKQRGGGWLPFVLLAASDSARDAGHRIAPGIEGCARECAVARRLSGRSPPR